VFLLVESTERIKPVARKFSIGGLCVCAGGLDILKIDKKSTDLQCSMLQFEGAWSSVWGTKPTNAPPWRRDWYEFPLSLFAAQYSDFTCLWISSSSFSEAFNTTPTYFFFGEKIVHVHRSEKHLMEEVVYTYWDKNTDCFVAIKSDFVFSSIVTTHIQKTLESTGTRAEHTYISSKHYVIHKSQLYFNSASHSG